MTTTVLQPWDWGIQSSRSGAGSWPIPWQPEPVDDITYHHQTVVGFASNLLRRRDTSSPEPPTPGAGGYYHSRWWVEFDLSALPGGETITAAELSVTMDVTGAVTLDAPAMDVYYVGRAMDPADPDDGCSQRDWELSDATLVGSVANPYVAGTHTLSVPAGLIGSGFCSLVFLLSLSGTPTGHPTAFDRTNVAIDFTEPTLTIVSGATAGGPPPSGGFGGDIAIRAKSPAEIDAELQRRRWAEKPMLFALPEEEWGTLDVGDIFTYAAPLADLTSVWTTARVIELRFSEEAGTVTGLAQPIHPPDMSSTRLAAARNLPAWNVNTATDLVGAIVAQRRTLEGILLEGLSA